jgi:hypothetical protein
VVFFREITLPRAKGCLAICESQSSLFSRLRRNFRVAPRPPRGFTARYGIVFEDDFLYWKY